MTKPKSKKAKLRAADKELSHSEIWDDSALVASWDEAVKEYQIKLETDLERAYTEGIRDYMQKKANYKYHSLHARGEKVEDVLKQVDDAESKAEGTTNTNPDDENQDINEESEDFQGKEADEEEEGELNQHSQSQSNAIPNSNPKTASINHAEQQTSAGASSTAAAAVAASVPHFVTSIGAPAQDETLKHVMMSWYWAGYYTGLYEGQQQQQQQQQQHTQPPGPV